MTLLDIRDLAVTYRTGGGELPAVRGVDLTVEAGQTVGIAGESGCGKSTLAGAVLRLLPATATVTGEVLLEDQDVLAMSWGKLRAVRWSEASIVFQGALHGLNPVQRIGRQIAEPILVHEPGTGAKAAARRATDLLEQVGVPAWRTGSYPHELSGGQRQRVMIAMALACNPQLVIADEPTTALDVMVQAQVLALLRDLVRDRRVGLLLISHDLSVLADACDRVAVMYAGRIVEHGPGGRLFDSAAHPYARALAAAFPVVGDRMSRLAPHGLPGDPPDPRELPSGCPFRPRCPEAVPLCAAEDVRLRPAGLDREAACVHVGVPA
ncbi:MAG TPA: ABC transporter ATP-binding protein [Asanoa sp.]|jgi:peptide/nickel transport system ATP-binding protein